MSGVFLAWNSVQWPSVIVRICRLQRRIYKAKLVGPIKRVHWLQNKLIHSLDAKLLAVHLVTTENKSLYLTSYPEGVIPNLSGLISDKKHRVVFSSNAKQSLAQKLSIDGKAFPSPSKACVRRSRQEASKVNCQVSFSKADKKEKYVFDEFAIRDRAKQALALLALEPEWEAVFEPNSFGFRPGRSVHDAMETIFSALHKGTLKHVFYADMREGFHKIDHSYLLSKLGTFKLMENQISAWLKAGIMNEFVDVNKPACIDPIQGGIISPLLINIAFHGIENHLKKFVSNLSSNIQLQSELCSDIDVVNCSVRCLPTDVNTSHLTLNGLNLTFSPNEGASFGVKNLDSHQVVDSFRSPSTETEGGKERATKLPSTLSQQPRESMEKSLIIVRFASDFLIFHAQRTVLELCGTEIQQWLEHTGCETSEKNYSIRDCRQSFLFLGFNIIQFRKNSSDYRVKITPSRQACLGYLDKVRRIIQHNRQVSTYDLIYRLKPVVIGWANYYRFCECSVVFRKMGNLLFQMLRHWVFRRHPRENRFSVKEKYWPSGRIYQFDKVNHKNNWVLCGKSYKKGGVLLENYLPHMSWVHRRKFVKIQGNKSPYDSNHTYWAERNSNNGKYSAFSNRGSLDYVTKLPCTY